MPDTPPTSAARCPHAECQDTPFDGMHFTGGYDAQGKRYYREFDEGCPWMGDEPVRRILIGGLCPRGSEHVWTYENDDGSCGSKSWPLILEVDPEDYDRLPEWVKGCPDAE